MDNQVDEIFRVYIPGPTDHPLEPPSEDPPAIWPMPDSSLLNDVELKQLTPLTDYSKFKLMMTSVMIVTYYIVHQDLAKYASRPYFTVCRSLIFVNLLTDIVLAQLISPSLPFRRTKGCLKIIAYINNIVAMLTSASILPILNKSDVWFIILQLPVICIAVAAICKDIVNGQVDVIIKNEDYQLEPKKNFDLSASATNAAFGGMISTIFGCFKNFPQDLDQVPSKFSEVFMLLSVSFGLLTVLLTTVSPSLHKPNARADENAGAVNFIQGFSCASFGFLILTVLAVGSEFVGSLIVLAFLPISFAVVVWFTMVLMQDNESSQSNGATGQEKYELGPSSITITTFIFAVIMAVYADNFTGGEYGLHLKAYMLLMSIVFMFSLSWIPQALKFPRTKSLEMAIKVLISCTIFGLALAMVGFIYLEINL